MNDKSWNVAGSLTQNASKESGRVDMTASFTLSDKDPEPAGEDSFKRRRLPQEAADVVRAKWLARIGGFKNMSGVVVSGTSFSGSSVSDRDAIEIQSELAGFLKDVNSFGRDHSKKHGRS